MGHRDLLASMTMDQNFTGKVTHGRHVFISIAQGSVEENDAIISKKAKGKGKYRGKNGKCAEREDNDSTDNFQTYDSKRLLMFLYQG